MEIVEAYKEVLGLDLRVLGKVEVLLRDEDALCWYYGQNCSASRYSWVRLPRKRYSWIFLRSALGISLEIGQFGYSAIGIASPYIVAVLTVEKVRGGWVRELISTSLWIFEVCGVKLRRMGHASEEKG